MKRWFLCLSTVHALLLAAAAPAAAQNEVKFTKDTYPRSAPARPITLPQWMIELRAEAMVNLSHGSAFKGVSLAPDLYVGFTDWFTFGVQHSQTLGVYNLPGTAPLCLSADDNAHCAGARVFNQIAFDGKFNVVRKPKFELAVHGVLGAIHTDPLLLGTRAGAAMRWRPHKLSSIDFDPALGFGFNDRDRAALGPALRNREFLYAPLRVTIQPNELFHLRLDFYAVLPFEQTASSYRVGTNLGVGFTLSSRIDLGCEVRLPALLGGDAYAGPYGGWNRRGVQAAETGVTAAFRF